VTERIGKDVGIDVNLRRLPPDVQAQMRRIWSDEEWAALSVEERERLSAWIIQLISTDIAEAMAAGTFDSRADAHTSRTISVVDEQGWRELTRIQAEALEASFAVQAESAERLAESGEAEIAAMSAMICCELPRRSSD
jgi:hypothetical protein